MQDVLKEIKSHMPLRTPSRRLFHGRGRCFPGHEDLAIDWFRPVVLIMTYRPYAAGQLDQLCRFLSMQSSCVKAVCLQERHLPGSPSRILWGELPVDVDAREDGLLYRLRLGEAQNIGFFPDMRNGRRLVRRIAEGKKVLNLFAYTCSFSVTALSGGASHVVNLDMNRGALDLGRFNHQLNHLDLRRASFLALELFRSFGRLRKLGPFDLLICDPPAYQGKSFKAERDWPKLLRKLPPLLAGGAELLLCLNAPHLPPDFLEALVAELLPGAILIDRIQPGEDFPERAASMGVWMLHYRMSP